MTSYHDKPCAAPGLISYRYGGEFGWIMIGAKDEDDALSEAARSTGGVAILEHLQVWNEDAYRPC